MEDTNAFSLLFGFEGRIPRSTYWLISIISFAVHQIAFMVLGQEAPFLVILCSVPVIWVSLAVQAKRWHDRDKSGWMVLIIFIPIIGVLWALVELGFLPGTVGANQYGPDPT